MRGDLQPSARLPCCSGGTHSPQRGGRSPAAARSISAMTMCNASATCRVFPHCFDSHSSTRGLAPARLVSLAAPTARRGRSITTHVTGHADATCISITAGSVRWSREQVWLMIWWMTSTSLGQACRTTRLSTVPTVQNHLGTTFRLAGTSPVSSFTLKGSQAVPTPVRLRAVQGRRPRVLGTLFCAPAGSRPQLPARRMTARSRMCTRTWPLMIWCLIRRSSVTAGLSGY